MVRLDLIQIKREGYAAMDKRTSRIKLNKKRSQGISSRDKRNNR